jgi:flagellar biosynthesis/type III secretory pathway protein FliH
MKLFNVKKTASILGLALAMLIGVSSVSAQNRGQIIKQRNQMIKQQQKIAKQNLKLEQQRMKLERQRLQAMQAQQNRYRVNRAGQWHTVDQRQTQLLQQAVNAGYQQGLAAGRNDRNYRRQMSWNNSNVYRSGTYGYQSYVNRDLYQHYFQQGFQRGYQDGYNSRSQFGNGGSILGTILQGILGLQRF